MLTLCIGYEGEIDVVAFNPRIKHLVHIETSTDADSWAERKRRFVKKFEGAKKHYQEIFDFQLKTVWPAPKKGVQF